MSRHIWFITIISHDFIKLSSHSAALISIEHLGRILNGAYEMAMIWFVFFLMVEVLNLEQNSSCKNGRNFKNVTTGDVQCYIIYV